MNLELMKEFSFEASHILPKHQGKCSRLHGHSWKFRVYVRGQIDSATGFVRDYADIKACVQPLIDMLDHHHLGTFDLGGVPHALKCFKPEYGSTLYPDTMYPSSENLLVWLADEISSRLPDWSRLELDETCTSQAILLREEYAKLRGI